MQMRQKEQDAVAAPNTAANTHTQNIQRVIAETVEGGSPRSPWHHTPGPGRYVATVVRWWTASKRVDLGAQPSAALSGFQFLSNSPRPTPDAISAEIAKISSFV